MDNFLPTVVLSVSLQREGGIMIIVTEAFYSALKGAIFYSFMLTRKLTEQLRIFHNYLYSIFGYNKI